MVEFGVLFVVMCSLPFIALESRVTSCAAVGKMMEVFASLCIMLSALAENLQLPPSHRHAPGGMPWCALCVHFINQ